MAIPRPLFFLASLGSTMTALSVPVVNWVTANGDAGFTDGTAATSSPVTTDADAETIVGSFTSVTLGIDEVITLTGSMMISGRVGAIPGNQIRWALFNAPAVPETGVGANYVGVWATVAGGGAPSNIRTADGSTDNPFSGSATMIVSDATDAEGDTLQYDTTYSFSLTVTRVDDTNISISATITDGVDFLIEWPVTSASASPASFTYDSVGILLGGTTNATSATFTDVDVSWERSEPSMIVITDLDYDRDGKMVTLTWSSAPGRIYAIDSSFNLETWPGDINDGVDAAEGSETTSYSFKDTGLGDHHFFRVREISN